MKPLRRLLRPRVAARLPDNERTGKENGMSDPCMRKMVLALSRFRHPKEKAGVSITGELHVGLYL